MPEIKTKKRNQLSDVEVSEISVVDKGAVTLNGVGNFLVFKRMAKATGQPDCLDLLERIQKGIDSLKSRNQALYRHWRNHMDEFDYRFSGPGEFKGDLTISLTLAKSTLGGSSSYFLPKGETMTHRFDRESGTWRPKQKQRG